MRPPTFKYLTASERVAIAKRLELVDMLIHDHGIVDHTTHEWCDPRDGCGTLPSEADATNQVPPVQQ